MKSKRRIVFDTNAFISAAILQNSVSNHALTLAAKQFEIVVSAATWTEFETRIERPKLFRYFGNLEAQREEVVKTIGRVVKHIVVQSVITDCRDPDDNKFLALAHDGEVEFIVSGDLALLALHPWRGVQILTPGDFVRVMRGAAHPG
jgi:uncharacterized protein